MRDEGDRPPPEGRDHLGQDGGRADPVHVVIPVDENHLVTLDSRQDALSGPRGVAKCFGGMEPVQERPQEGPGGIGLAQSANGKDPAEGFR